MIKSLYLRIVITFLAIVLVSVGAAFLIMSIVYTKQSNHQLRVDLQTVATQAIATFKQDSFHDFSNYAHTIMTVKGYSISIYAPSLISVYPPDHVHPIPSSLILTVLAGHTVPVNSPMHTPNVDRQSPSFHPNFSLLGIPFTVGKTHYALFIASMMPPPAPKGGFFSFLNFVLIIVLLLGSLLILIASRYLVKPIKVMTEATRRVAKGDFDVIIQFKRQDEIGRLAQSFTSMIHELKQMEMMRQEFVSNVSHEIQSPLTSIQGFSRALQEGIVPLNDQERYLAMIVSESDRLSRLSDNLLRLASLDSDHHPFHRTSYRLDEQLRRIVVATEPQWVNKNLEIELLFTKTMIFADQDLLEQVWMNLLVNAIRYTPVGGKITIRIEQTSTSLRIAFHDTGQGIAKEELETIFERFYKVDKSRTRSHGGSGLGLSIVKKILDLHQAKIEVQSEVQQGSLFTVIIDHTATS